MSLDETSPPRLPRFAYWVAGTLIAGAGAIGARYFADYVPGYRIIVWGIGAAVIFFGLAVLSMGTRSRLETHDIDEKSEGQ